MQSVQKIKSKKMVLAISTLPPPIGGVTVLCEITLDILKEDYEVELLPAEEITLKRICSIDYTKYKCVVLMAGNILKYLSLKWLLLLILLRFKHSNLVIRGYAGYLRNQISILGKLKIVLISIFVKRI